MDWSRGSLNRLKGVICKGLLLYQHCFGDCWCICSPLCTTLSCYFHHLSYTHEIEAVSCDEAFIDVSKLVRCDTEATSIAEQIRREIYDTTGCTASAGIGWFNQEGSVQLPLGLQALVVRSGCFSV